MSETKVELPDWAHRLAAAKRDYERAKAANDSTRLASIAAENLVYAICSEREKWIEGVMNQAEQAIGDK